MKNENLFRFPGFLAKACTLSYDDGELHDERLIEIMRKYGLKGTFNLNSRNIKSGSPYHLGAEKIKELFGSDTEIALHGFEHLSLAKVTPPLAVRDVIANKEYLEESFAGVIRGMAYAGGSLNDEVVDILRLCDVAYSRTTLSTEAFDLPEDWLRLNPTCHHKNPKLFELVDKFLETETHYRRIKPKLFYLWGHSFEFARDNNWDVIEKFGEIMTKRDDVWHATNMEIYNYVEAFGMLRFSAALTYVENPTATDVYLSVMGNQIIAKAATTTKIR